MCAMALPESSPRFERLEPPSCDIIMCTCGLILGHGSRAVRSRPTPRAQACPEGSRDLHAHREPHLHVCVHAVVLDGVFSKDAEAAPPTFHPVSPPTERDEVLVSARICQRVAALLRRRGLVDPDATAERAPTPLDKWYAKALEERARLALVADDGHVAPRAVWPFGRPPSTGELGGFSVHARVSVGPGDRVARERLVRYCARPPFAEDQLSETEDGRIALELPRPRWTGETHAIFEPLQFIRRAAWMIPPPRQHQVRFAGVLASAARLRKEIIPAHTGEAGIAPLAAHAMPDESSARSHRIDWATLLARVGIDALKCPRCGGRMRILAAITEPAVIRHILEHLGLPTEPPSLSPPRGPP